MEATLGWQSCKLFIGGLAAQTTTEVLRGHFSKYGRLIDAVVMSKQGRPRGFGFVTFETPASAAKALSEPQWLGDRFVDVKRAVPGEQPEERSPNKIFVGGLPQDASTEDLRACFTEYGPIADAVVMVDRRTKRSRGFGFIRFASSPQGTRAAEKVLQDAANHRLGGKWVEVKRATPAALLSDSSPTGSSSPCTPQHQRDLKQRDLQTLWSDSCIGLWGGLTGWGGAAELSPTFSQLSFDSPALSPFDGMTPFRVDRVASQFPEPLDRFDRPVLDRRLFPDLEQEEQSKENRPSAANRAVTPPPGQLLKRPPGLGIEASPMKIECGSSFFDGLVTDDRHQDIIKVQTQTLLSAY